MPNPNPRQRALIEGHSGIYLVDAGAGTGKTFALARRYASIVEQPDVAPDDVMLVTFTRNAATEMKDRVVDRSSYSMRTLRDAPIQTFHSRCHDLLLEYGFHAPNHLGIDDHIADTTRVIEDDLIERAEFELFFDRFSDEHPGFDDLYRIIGSPAELLGLIRELAAKGVFPTDDGWYRSGERHLDGDFDAFYELFRTANEPRKQGNKQSVLREKLNGLRRNNCYLPEAPRETELRGNGKAVPEEVAAAAFQEDRETLKAFVHDVYFGYLEYALARNYVTYGMLQLFAYVLLCEDHALRDELAFEYVMVDEFQDTSEIQFKLALLSCGSDNFCVVGDWKQSIYGFQYAAVENIVKFETRLERFAEDLNAGHERVQFDDRSVSRIELEENYRSTQAVLDFAETGLVVPATQREIVDVAAVRDRIVSLESNKTHEHTRIEAVQCENEHEALLTKVQSIVDNDDYAIEDEGEVRAPKLGDIAVLTRTKDYGRELVHAAGAYDIPIAYEGGIELFRTDQAKLLLAWLRILEADIDRGWAVVLERAGYTLDEIKRILDTASYPAQMITFRAELESLDSVGAVAERVLNRYGYDGSYADVVIETVQATFDATTMTRGDLIHFIERGIEEGATQEVSAPAGTDAITVQTIHAAKGLEYPIVVIANMNQYAFPPSGGSGPVVSFDDPIGLRQRKEYADAHGYSHIYDNWRADVLRRCLPNEYDEERRLLYVAMTRAEQHLLFTAGESPNTFLAELDVDIEEIEPDVQDHEGDGTVQARLDISVPMPVGPESWSPHDLMSEAVFAETAEGKGTVFGTEIHQFAEAYANEKAGIPTGPEPDWEHVMAFLDERDGQLLAEQETILPLTVGDRSVVIAGVVDLVHVQPDEVEVIDFKTDRERTAQSEYHKQLSVYHHVIAEEFPDRPITTAIFYTEEGELVELEPLSRGELGQLVAELSTQPLG